MLKNQRMLITGLTGLIGGGITDRLAAHNEIWGLARYSNPGSRERLEALGVRTVKGDIAQGEFHGLPEEPLDVVLHIAADTRPGVAETAMTQNPEATALLMHRFRDCKAFLFVSNSSLYLDNPDPLHAYRETDHVGGWSPHSPNYAPSKLASEAVVRSLARIYSVPSTIARMNVAYGGVYDDGGLPGKHLESLLANRPIRLPASRPHMMSPIHEDDIVAHLDALVRAASVPATIVNWGGEEGASTEEWVRYMADLIGVEPIFERSDAGVPPSRILDPARGRAIGLEWTVGWKEGLRRMINARHPELELKP